MSSARCGWRARERGDAFVPGEAAVELEVPGVEADLGEEGVDGGLVGEELAVEEPGVPADEDVADVEDDGAFGHGAHLAETAGKGKMERWKAWNDGRSSTMG